MSVSMSVFVFVFVSWVFYPGPARKLNFPRGKYGCRNGCTTHFGLICVNLSACNGFFFFLPEMAKRSEESWDLCTGNLIKLPLIMPTECPQRERESYGFGFEHFPFSFPVPARLFPRPHFRLHYLSLFKLQAVAVGVAA